MNEIEDTHCEPRKIVNLQFCDLERLSRPLDDDTKSLSGSPGFNGSTSYSGKSLGGFFEDCNYAWLSCQSRLIVFNAKTGASISSWTFRDRITCVSQFPSLPGQIPLVLVSLDNEAVRIKESRGTICVFDCTTSQVLRAIRIPAGVERACIISGGATWEESSDNKIHDFPIDSNGIACVALRNIDHFMIDLKRNTWENFNDFHVYDDSSPWSIDILRDEKTSRSESNRKKSHAAFNLVNKRLEDYIGFQRDEFESSMLSDEILTTSMISSQKIGCLISGCLGRIIIWQYNGAVRWISSPINANLSISHLALLEPTDDPRPFCYLWANYQEDMASSISQPPILRMYSMLFERKYTDKGTNFYMNLEGEPRIKFDLEMEEGCRVTNIHPIVRDNNPEQTESGNKRGEDNLLLIGTDTLTLLFDLNQWYKEQMPKTVHECHNINAILACYQNRSNINRNNESHIISCGYMPESLREFSKTGQGSPEEFLYPNSLALEWSELEVNRITIKMTRGIQSQLLRDMSMAGPIIILEPSDTYQRCVNAGLIPCSSDSSFNTDVDSQRDSLLTLCLEQRWTTFLLKCIKEWSDGSAAYLFPTFLRWGIQRASAIKLTTHQLCIPLFDQSGSTIGEAEVKILRSFSQQMECLSSIVESLPRDYENLEQQQHQQRVLRRVLTYLNVLLWFYDVGLLPETYQVDEETLPISFTLNIPYPVDKLTTMYANKRMKYLRMNNGLAENNDNNEKDLFIDELITRECPAIITQWEKEGFEMNSIGCYPPPSLQSLLRSILTDCYKEDTNEIENKHQIIIYLLMDLVMLLQASYPGADQLIKYPAAFKLSPSLIKLTQAFWLLDHDDFQGFSDIITGQLVSDSDVKDWHHRLIIRTLLRSRQNKLALIYLKVRKPPLSSIDDQGIVISLSVERGLVQSAFHRRPPSHYTQLLYKFFRSCRASGRLNDILLLALDPEEEEAFLKFLEEEKCEETRLLYYLQRCQYSEASSILPTAQCRMNLERNNKPASLMMFNAYSATLPEITRRFSSSNSIRTSIGTNTKSTRYPHPMSHCTSRGKNREIHESVIKKAKETFVRDKSHIPFITAPCLPLKKLSSPQESNRVLFLEPVEKKASKRKLEQMRSYNSADSDTDNNIKRRKIEDTDAKIIENKNKNLEMSIIFETPIVKRKNQSVISDNIPAETPHSILKIRQMINDSTSLTTNLPENIEDKEKKPRQIRFSINQLNITQVDSSTDHDGTCEKLDVTNEQQEESIKDNDDLHSINIDTSAKALSESPILSNDSFASNISGPRPRPGLQRISINDTSKNLLKKSLIQNFLLSKPSSGGLCPDVSITADIASSTLIIPCAPKSSETKNIEVIYTSTILDSNASLPLTAVNSSPQAKPCLISNSNLHLENLFDLTTEISNNNNDGNDLSESMDETFHSGIDSKMDDTFELTSSADLTERSFENIRSKMDVDEHHETEESCLLKDLDNTKEHQETIKDCSREAYEECSQDHHDTDEEYAKEHHDIDEESLQHPELLVLTEEHHQTSENSSHDQQDIIEEHNQIDEDSSQHHPDIIEERHQIDKDSSQDHLDIIEESHQTDEDSSLDYPDIVEEHHQIDEDSSQDHPDIIEECNQIDEDSRQVDDNFVQEYTGIIEEQEIDEISLQGTSDIIEEYHQINEYSLQKNLNIIDEHPKINKNILEEQPDLVEEHRQSNKSPAEEHQDITEEHHEIDEVSTQQHSDINDENSESDEENVIQLSESEDELMPLNYEEDIDDDDDKDDVFISLSNSLNTSNRSGLMPCENVLESSRLILPEAPAPSSFYAPFDMTDDESSRSRDASVAPLENFENEEIVVQTEKNCVDVMEVCLVDSDTADITDDDDNDIHDSQKYTSSAEATVNNEIIKTSPTKLETTDEKSTTNIVESNNKEHRPRMLSVSEELENSATLQRTTRLTRASSVVPSNVETPETITTGRRKRATSLVKDILTPSSSVINPVVDSPVRRITRRAASIQKELYQAVKTQDKHSVVNESNDVHQTEEIKIRRTRAPSITKEISNDDAKEIKVLPRRKKRGTSVPKDSKTEDVGNDSVEIISQDNLVINDNTENTEILHLPRKAKSTALALIDETLTTSTRPRRKRAGSVTQDTVAKNTNEGISTTRRTRASSITKDEVKKEIIPRRTRASSLTKEIEPVDTSITSIVKRRRLRANSLATEISEENDDNNSEKPVTRRRTNSLKGTGRMKRGNSLVKEVIPEEENGNGIFVDSNDTQDSNRVTGVSIDSSSINSRSDLSVIPSIPEEDEDISEPSGSMRGKRRGSITETGRRRRAASMDLDQGPLKRRTRAQAKNIIKEDPIEEDSVINENSKKTHGRKKRAMSETKDVDNHLLIEKPKRGRRPSQKNTGEDESFRFSPPELTRFSPTAGEGAEEIPDFTFSPPHTKLDHRKCISSQPRK